MKVAYWPGCVSRGFTPELHGSMAAVAPKLDIELVELDRANCCGAGVIAEHNQELVDTLNARTFALAQKVDGAAGMMNICSTCQGAQSECQERLDADAAYRAHINEHLDPEGLEYEKGGAWWNKNLLWLLVEEIGLDALRERVVRPLEGLRVGPFYGCYIVRPTRRLVFADHAVPALPPQPGHAAAGRREVRRARRPGHPGAAPAAGRRPRARSRAQGARD